MLKLENSDIEFIKKYLDNFEKLLKETDVNVILKTIYDFIDLNGFDENEDYNDLGREAQKVYDNIYLNN